MTLLCQRAARRFATACPPAVQSRRIALVSVSIRYQPERLEDELTLELLDEFDERFEDELELELLDVFEERFDDLLELVLLDVFEDVLPATSMAPSRLTEMRPGASR